jgi:hypothetical protein
LDGDGFVEEVSLLRVGGVFVGHGVWVRDTVCMVLDFVQDICLIISDKSSSLVRSFH